MTDPHSLHSKALPDRKLNLATLEHFGVKVEVSETNAEPVAHYYPITKDNKITGWKVRKLPKQFHTQGDCKGDIQLFGQNVCPSGGKRLLITGGELDALSAWQMLNEKYPSYPQAVVSLPKGENISSVKENLPFINSFEEVIIYTDMDEPGRVAAADIAKLIGPKARIVKTTEKDASDMLVKGKKSEFITAYFNAEKRKPEGIVAGSSLTLDFIRKATRPGYDTPYPKLNEMIGGFAKGELTTLTAGSGIGKSTLARELGYCLRKQHDLTIGNIFLEETNSKTAMGYIALDNNIPLKRLRKLPELLSNEEWTRSYNSLIGSHTDDSGASVEKWFAFDHFGSMATDELMDKVRYLAYAEKCDFIILDHLSMVISGNSSDNERKDLDIIMTELAAFCNESGVGVIVVVHLSRNKGKASFNEGGSVSLTDLRGSAALEQLSWNVIALERNQQGEEDKDISQIRVLKSREEGETGIADTCLYDKHTGRLVPYSVNIGDY